MGHTGTLQGSGERPAPPVLALRLQQEDKGDTQVCGHRPQGHSPRPQDKGGRGKTLIRGGDHTYRTQDFHRQPVQAGQGPEPDCLHVGTFGRKPGFRTVPQDRRRDEEGTGKPSGLTVSLFHLSFYINL